MNHIERQNKQLAVTPPTLCSCSRIEAFRWTDPGLQSLSAAARHSIVAEANGTCLQVWGSGTTPSLCSAAHSRGTDGG